MASDAPGSTRAPETIALLIAQAQSADRGWLGWPSRLTGEASAPLAPTHHALIADRAAADWPRPQCWEGTRLSLHRDTPGPARGLVVGLMNIAADAETEFNDWYETEHMPRLAAVAGVLVAARYRAGSGHAPAYLALYQMEDVAISQSAAWMHAARTPWAARMRRFSSDFRRYSFARDDVADI
ncbi:DUF4286 family protein [Hephaestia sp. GCM10023244]|uniref:DUF4286 family protein n=1 Tax=unclassified Hephaestia TaxID=2631281 RepID=UPI00207767BF|nr:DUF4286 family protein [Hephaestia sp. MAHUQ-44]MCM8732052.1 hypothetical protein [Hephaestia sp. MAHUQ-44]